MTKLMKKLKMMLLLCICVVICLGTTIKALADEYTDGDFVYYEYGDYACITDYIGNATDIVIPNKVGGYPVDTVWSSAFTEEDEFKTVTVSDKVGYVNIPFCALASGCKINILGDETGLGVLDYEEGKKVYVECNWASQARYSGNVEHIYRDGQDLSKAKITVTPSKITKSQALSGGGPQVKVSLNGKTLTYGDDYYMDNAYYTQEIGKVTATVHGAMNDTSKVYGTKEFTFTIVPDAPEHLLGNTTTTYNKAGIKWDKSEDASGYEIYRKEKSGYKRIARVKSTVTTYLNKSLKESTGYTYKVRAYKWSGGKRIYSAFSNEVTVYTLPKKVKTTGYILKNQKISIKATIDNVDAYDGYNSNWTSPNEINNFMDHKGRYNVSYSAGNYVYIQRYSTTLKRIKTLKIKKKYPVVGDVICDKSGNYYIAWGKDDVKGNGNVVTFAISKYSYSGKHIKTTTLKSYSGYDCKWIFSAGSCDMAIQGNHLVCSYAKEMYNGHQKNETFAVNIKTMKKVTGYSYWVSHSFNQKVIALKDGGVLFGDHGDAYSRGFVLNYNNLKTNTYNEYVPFHFWCLNTDDMFHVNRTYAELGGIGEVDTGYVLVGTSAKSMNSKAPNQKQQLMIQIINPNTGKSILKGSSRTGSCYGTKYTDTGIKWLTNYKDGSYATNPKVLVVGRDRILVMWEKHKDYEYKGSYYMILSSSGKILKNTTSLKKARLCGNEDLNYYKGYVYWTSSQIEYKYSQKKGYYQTQNTVIHKLKVSNVK